MTARKPGEPRVLRNPRRLRNPRTCRIFVPSCHLQRPCPIQYIGNSLSYIFNSRNTLGGKTYAFWNRMYILSPFWTIACDQSFLLSNLIFCVLFTYPINKIHWKIFEDPFIWVPKIKNSNCTKMPSSKDDRKIRLRQFHGKKNIYFHSFLYEFAPTWSNLVKFAANHWTLLHIAQCKLHNVSSDPVGFLVLLCRCILPEIAPSIQSHSPLFIPEQTTEPVFVDLLWRPGIDSQPGGPVRNPICRTGLPGYIGWRNRFLGIDSWAP